MLIARIGWLSLTLLAFSACAEGASSPDPALNTRNPKLKVQWVKPDTKLAPFDKIVLAPTELQFRPVAPLVGTSGTYMRNRDEFPVPDNARADIAKIFDKAFSDRIGKNKHIKLTDQPGPGVLVVKTSLQDIVSRVPPEEIAGRYDAYLDTVADATLVVDFVDPTSGQTLGSAVDRRTAAPVGTMAGGFGAVHSDRVSTNQEVRQLANRWANSLDKRLEQLYFEAKPK